MKKLMGLFLLLAAPLFAQQRVVVHSQDGTQLSALYFAADNPTAQVLALHGLQSNSRWFMESGKFLAKNGISVLAYDRRGSGSSAGYVGHVENSQKFIDDIHAAYHYLKAKNPDLEIHLHANCFGSRIALPYASFLPANFASIILTAPATDMSSEATYSAFELIGIGAAWPNKYFATPLSDDLFSSEERVVGWIQNDEKSQSLRFVTKNFLMAASSLTRHMKTKAIKELRLPLYVVLSSEDRIVENDKITTRFERDYNGPLKIDTFKSDHLIEMGPSQKDYRRSMLSWIVGLSR